MGTQLECLPKLILLMLLLNIVNNVFHKNNHHHQSPNKHNNNNNNNNNDKSKIKLYNDCGLFNSLDGCKYGVDCYRPHVCRICDSKDHGKTTCPKNKNKTSNKKNWRCQLEHDAQAVAIDVVDDEVVVSEHQTINSNEDSSSNNDNNKKYLFNTPPLSYKLL